MPTDPLRVKTGDAVSLRAVEGGWPSLGIGLPPREVREAEQHHNQKKHLAVNNTDLPRASVCPRFRNRVGSVKPLTVESGTESKLGFVGRL